MRFQGTRKKLRGFKRIFMGTIFNALTNRKLKEMELKEMKKKLGVLRGFYLAPFLTR